LGCINDYNSASAKNPIFQSKEWFSLINIFYLNCHQGFLLLLRRGWYIFSWQTIYSEGIFIVNNLYKWPSNTWFIRNAALLTQTKFCVFCVWHLAFCNLLKSEGEKTKPFQHMRHMPRNYIPLKISWCFLKWVFSLVFLGEFFFYPMGSVSFIKSWASPWILHKKNIMGVSQNNNFF
jgi:hypothetical protein